MMKRTIFCILVAIVCAYSAVAATVKVERPVGKHATSFAIVIDDKTFDKCQAEVIAYRDALDADNLAAYIISGDWSSPEQVREQLSTLYKSNARKMPLEGAVFIGDVPFVSVQNAQHMTTAFKMNEDAFPRDEASVTSDRFYDDLNLKFEYIGRDSLNALRFYYRLAASSPQRLNPSFYSGRILYPSELGGDKYAAIAKYLRKVVEERSKVDKIDYLTTFAGHGYNSDCLTTWIDESRAVEELFPAVIRNNSRALTQLNFRMERYMKYNLFDQLQRPEVDVMLFNEHGSPDKQHISGGEPTTSFIPRVEALKGGIYMNLYFEKRKKDGDIPGAIEHFKKEYNLTDKFFESYLSPKKDKDEVDKDADPDPTIISLDDLKGRKPQPRFVMFNACYNGSFHRAGYVAGYYIFSDGRTVVAQGNTVNVLQDRWTYEMLGLLSHGARVGQYNRMVATLEGHIIGDPAFHFQPISDYSIAADLAAKRCDTADKAANRKSAAFWQSQIDAPYADIQSAAVRMLADGGAIDAKGLLDKFRSTKFATTRMECLKMLSRYGYCPETIAAVGEALYDNYEVVRRNAANYSWQMCAPELLPKVVDVVVNYPESQRVGYTLTKALQLYPKQEAMSALKQAIEASLYPKSMDDGLQKLEQSIDDMQARKVGEMKQLLDAKAPMARRISQIRSVRNNTYHEYVPQLIELMNDSSQPEELRVLTAEALGWFVMSPCKADIIKACSEIKTDSKALQEEAEQTVNRLK